LAGVGISLAFTIYAKEMCVCQLESYLRNVFICVNFMTKLSEQWSQFQLRHMLLILIHHSVSFKGDILLFKISRAKT